MALTINQIVTTEERNHIMINSGTMGMPLHFGKMPRWLTERMGLMGSAVIESVVQNYGKSEVLTRLSNPNWFQAFGAVMGMQWNSSGVTAAVLGSLKGKINPAAHDLGIYILGGKGKYSYYAPNQIKRVSDKPYRWSIGKVALSRVANREKMLPRRFISRDGFRITTACKRYLSPLVRGEDYPPYANGIPAYRTLKNVAVERRLRDEFVIG